TSLEILSMSAEDYPEVPKVDPNRSFSIPQKLLKSMINQTKYACAVVDTKPALMGCKFEIDNNVLNVVAVDGIRIALRQEPVVYDNIEFIVPLKTLEELTHILTDDSEKNVTICIDKNQISFDVEGYTMISRLIDGDFIQYKKHLETDAAICAEVNCREIIEMLERSMLVINEKSKCPIRCEFNGDTLSMSCVTALGKINDKINIKYNGDPITIGFNAKYLLDAFKACDSDCAKIVLAASAVAPIIIIPMEGRAFTFLLLPMRLK
ncbi:MAG: DNA polymerase III subunit beta, partial [Oscillospiraceae bacterium]